MFRLAIYEDNQRLRNSMQLLLDDGVHFAITGAYAHCNQVQENIAECRPDIVLMDIDMPGLSGIEGVRQVKSVNAAIKIIMYTVFEDDDRIFESICAGADGYLLKNTPTLKIIQGMQDVMNGEKPMSPFIAQRVFNHFRTFHKPASYALSDREKEVLTLLVNGNSYKMIAAHCSISIETVKKHLRNIYTKLQVNCATEAVAKALREQIVPL
jgi:DNA-binding NarL/FixJ family response regulator